jgi:hypothetical protein
MGVNAALLPLKLQQQKHAYNKAVIQVHPGYLATSDVQLSMEGIIGKFFMLKSPRDRSVPTPCEEDNSRLQNTSSSDASLSVEASHGPK